MRALAKAVPLLAGATLFGALVPSTATAMSFNLHLPGPGQATAAVAQLRYKGKAPRNLRLKLENPSKLGPAYRGIYSVYRARHGGATALTVVTLVLRKEARSVRASSASTARTSRARASLGVFFEPSRSRPDGSAEGEGVATLRMRAPTLHCESELLGEDAPLERPPSFKPLLEYGNVDPDGGNAIDTGHYDDGHSFGWAKPGTKAAVGDWLNLSRSADASYAELVEKIERHLNEDLDGDGEVGGSGKAGGTIETEVGAPVIK